jgi:signal peptidase I
VVLSAAATVAAWPALARIARSWPNRVTVAGHSMEPTLRDGEWLLVEPERAAGGRARPGVLVVVDDPRAPGRRLVKRVQRVADHGALVVAADHPAHRNDAIAIGLVGRDLVIGRPWFRYWPPARFGRVR